MWGEASWRRVKHGMGMTLRHAVEEAERRRSRGLTGLRRSWEHNGMRHIHTYKHRPLARELSWAVARGHVSSAGRRAFSDPESGNVGVVGRSVVLVSSIDLLLTWRITVRKCIVDQWYKSSRYNYRQKSFKTPKKVSQNLIPDSEFRDKSQLESHFSYWYLVKMIIGIDRKITMKWCLWCIILS